MFDWDYDKNRLSSLDFIKSTFPTLWETKMPSKDYYFKPGSYHEALPEFIYTFSDDHNNEGKVITKIEDDDLFEIFMINFMTTEMRESNTHFFQDENFTGSYTCPLLRNIYKSCLDCEAYTQGGGKHVIGIMEEQLQTKICQS